jgi:transcriptional regulator with XRE-family HTH domain
MELKERILAEQVKRKLTNKQMAELLGVDNATYWRYKKGLTNNLRDTQKIIQKLEIKFA